MIVSPYKVHVKIASRFENDILRKIPCYFVNNPCCYLEFDSREETCFCGGLYEFSKIEKKIHSNQRINDKGFMILGLVET